MIIETCTARLFVFFPIKNRFIPRFSANNLKKVIYSHQECFNWLKVRTELVFVSQKNFLGEFQISIGFGEIVSKYFVWPCLFLRGKTGGDLHNLASSFWLKVAFQLYSVHWFQLIIGKFVRR